MEFNTALLHQQFDSDTQNGATIPPIYQVSAFAQSSAEQLEKVFNNKAAGFAYTRISNPTVDAFERRVASMEKGIGAVACSSGMAAVTMALLNILEAGDEVIAGSGLFGGTIDLFGDLKAFGITTHFVESVTAEAVAPLLNEKTKVVFTELIGNPKLDVVDLKKVSALVHEHGVPLIIDLFCLPRIKRFPSFLPHPHRTTGQDHIHDQDHTKNKNFLFEFHMLLQLHVLPIQYMRPSHILPLSFLPPKRQSP